MEDFLLGDNDSAAKAEFMVRNRAALDRLKSIRLSQTNRGSLSVKNFSRASVTSKGPSSLVDKNTA